MKIHPISPALYIVGVFSLVISLFTHFLGDNWFDPVIGIAVFLLCQELSKFVAEYTMEKDDGTDSH